MAKARKFNDFQVHSEKYFINLYCYYCIIFARLQCRDWILNESKFVIPPPPQRLLVLYNIPSGIAKFPVTPILMAAILLYFSSASSKVNNIYSRVICSCFFSILYCFLLLRYCVGFPEFCLTKEAFLCLRDIYRAWRIGIT